MKRKRTDSGSWVITKARIHCRSSIGKIGKRRGSTTFSNFSDEASLDVFPVTVNKEENGREVKARFKRQMSYNARTFVKPFFMNRVKHGDTTVSIVVVIVLGIAGNVWKDTEARKLWYVQYPNESPWYEWVVIPLRFELLCSIMIPISIKVSLDLVKSLYAKFIDWDNEMIDLETGTPAHAANTAISEDLGQVEYIMTDKTGTLTENKMIFRRCYINGIFYGNESGDALKDAELINAVGSGSPDVVRFLTVMAICNTVIRMQSKSGSISYKAQSQDEEALVRAASCLNVYDVLDTLEFTSDRKRMSVVVKDCKSGKIILLSKGADEAILPYARAGQQTRTSADAVEQYAQMGLRTLCLAWRELEEDEYREWSSLFKEANSTLVDREWRVAKVCQRLEHDFEILGIAAIEDRLQASIFVGTLQFNLYLTQPKGQLLLINGKTEDEVSRSLERVLLTMRITNSEAKDVAFVIDGWALEIALKDYKKAFTELAILSRTAICCRVTPSQKAQLVELLKSCDYRTLAIGDGGNDVRMIQQADIGVGISGREGLQAARAADYKFRFLQRLILVHGRYSYNRTAFLSQYSFYKSLVICFIQIFVSGTSLFNSVSLMAYNVFYTSILVLVSVLDKDLGESTVMQHPQILFYCQAGRLLNPSTFVGWFGRSLFHAIVVFVITIHAYAFEKSEMEEISMVALSGCIWLQAFVVALETNSFTILQHLAIWGNLVGFYIINWIVSGVPSLGMYTIMFRLCRQPSYWKTMLVYLQIEQNNILQQAERLGGPILSLGNIEPQLRSLEKDVTPLTISPLSITQPKNRNPVCEPLLSDSPNDATRRSFGSGTQLDFFQSQSRLIFNQDPNPLPSAKHFVRRIFQKSISNIDNTRDQPRSGRRCQWQPLRFAGNETKLGMSTGIPEPKLTAMDAMIDKLTGAIFIFQIVVVIVLGIAGNVWKDTEARKLWYVQYPNESPWYEWVVIPLRFELLCSIMIPISIKVSLDLVKSLYAKFIDWDNEMIDLETGAPAHAANTAISEDLGQVEYIMTDKTGTLTEKNKMIFRRCYINGIFYGNESGDALKDAELINAVGSGSPDVVRFLTVMAICNTVIPMQSKSGSISYKAQSQDEEALVRAASCLNVVFFNKNANILEINFNRAILQYDVLDTLEFTSDRKRMSVVVKDCKSGKIILLSKGADEAILPYARAGQQTRTSADAVEQYAQMGLRTLCLAWRELEEDEYREWSSLFKEANSTLVDREWRVAEVCQRLEHDFEILGIAAIEDRLQASIFVGTLQFNLYLTQIVSKNISRKINVWSKFVLGVAMDAMIDKLTGAIFIFQIVVVIVLGIAGNVWKDTEARKVSLDLVKSLYAKFIDWDNEMIDLETGTPAHAANTAISEDLGQVEYIMTDKTGTLTENKMIFRRCHINGIFYGNESGDALKDVELINAVGSGSPDVVRFLTVMAICNTVIPMQSKSESISYKAQSQDEEALVRAASCLNMVFFNKNANILEINFNRAILQYDVLDTLEFTSDRKRMSVVVKDCKSGKIILLSKGADEAILPYARAGQQTRTSADAVEQYAQMGLRTLCLAWRELEEDEYREWSSLFKEANSTLVDREWRVAEVCQRLEHDFEILGIAAIEDQPKGQLLLINGKTEDEVSRSLERVLLTMRITTSEAKQDVAFVIDGWALEIALKDYKKAFTELAILSRTAICCRVTPSQKAQLLEFLKSCDYRTLAIGDGGNDVRMIQQADIGVGISGREGLQAARAADYSIGKFRFLQRLILVHGRYSYNRTAFLSQYSFYKSLVICFIQIFLFNSVSLMAYNVFYTSIPVLVSVLDKDLGNCSIVITIHAYAFEKSEMEEISMVALSGCIWLQAFVVALETNSFTILQHLAIWGNMVGFYIINWIVSGVPSSRMYTIMFRLYRQPSYWKTMLLIVAAGMGPVLALKYFRYTYRSSKINILQKAERLGGPILSLGNIEPQLRLLEKDVTPLTISPLSITQPKNRNPVCEPLLSDSPNAATRRSFGSVSYVRGDMAKNSFDIWVPVQRNFSPEKIGPEKFWPREISVQRNFSPKKIGPEKFWPREIWSREISVQRNSGPEKFGPEKFQSREILAQRNLVQRNFSPKTHIC
ncbi:hypothetical protein HYC85_015011 [Camellia sinensis]|uniref:P-type ATPase C-terminal domain-containing protein n=1 Tax=Camellia sinensis TaxID=4442 RepID=A0A7J7HAZ9_CAMSI|nr:hypothetical protein HYC85_015011 [Camellia sinensis]